jgi:L-ribulose-5-phosphate 3-epimerase
MKIGALDGVLKVPWSQLFPEAQRLGFDGVELGVGENYTQTLLWSEEGRQQLSDWSQQNNVEISSLCLHSFWRFSFADPDPAVRAVGREILTSALRFCRELGVKVILVPITGPSDLPKEEGAQRWIEELQRCAPVAEEMGVSIGLENVGRPYGRTAQDLLQLIEAVHSPRVGAYYDPGNAQAAGNNPPEEIRQIGKHLVQMHVKDYQGALLGEGQVNLKECLVALSQIGYEGFLVLETPAMEDPVRSASYNLGYLRGLIRGLQG